MRLVDLHLDADRPVHLELHERLTVLVADPELGSRLAGLLGRAYVLAGTGITGTIDGGEFLTPFDPTAVVALDLQGEGLRTFTSDDLPPPDPAPRQAARLEAQAELERLAPLVDRARAELDRQRRVLDATVAAVAAGREELESSTARRDDLVTAASALEQRPPELERERASVVAAADAATARVQELLAVHQELSAALGPEGDASRFRMGDDTTTLASLLDRAAAVGGLGPAEHAEAAQWCVDVTAGRAAVHPTARELLTASADIEAAWELAAHAGVEGDPEVVAALAHRDALAEQRELLDRLARSGLLGDTARSEIDAAHAAVVGAKKKGGNHDVAVAAEDRALARYGFDSHLDFTIATSTRSVGQKAEAKLRSVTQDLDVAGRTLVEARDRAAARLERLAEQREPMRQRITDYLGFRPEGPAAPALEAIPAVPDAVRAAADHVERAVEEAREEVVRYRDMVADLDEERSSLGRQRAELADQRRQVEARMEEISSILVRAEQEIGAAEIRTGDATTAARSAEAAWVAAGSAVDELDDASDRVYTEHDADGVVESLLSGLDPWAPSPRPVLLYETLAPLGAAGTAAVLGELRARADRTQLIYLTADQAVREWAETLDPSEGRCVVLTRSRWPRRLARRVARSRD